MIVAICALFGVPLNFVAMNALTAMLTDDNDIKSAMAVISKPVTPEEYQKILQLNLGSDDGMLSYDEYIIICGMRIHALDPELVRLINLRFDVLDVNKSGSLTYDEITQMPSKQVSIKQAW